MKKITQYISVFLMLVIFSSSLLAGQKGSVKTQTLTHDSIEANYLAALKSDNRGLRISSAYFLGELKSDKAVTQLMKMLRDDNSKAEKMMAALSLVKIGNPRGLFMVKREAIFNNNEQVRVMCDRFYNASMASVQ